MHVDRDLIVSHMSVWGSIKYNHNKINSRQQSCNKQGKSIAKEKIKMNLIPLSLFVFFQFSSIPSPFSSAWEPLLSPVFSIYLTIGPQVGVLSQTGAPLAGSQPEYQVTLTKQALRQAIKDRHPLAPSLTHYLCF